MTIVDLTYPVNERTPFWPGPQYFPFHLETIATLEKDGVLSKKFCTPEHLGTHCDAPNHFVAGQIDVGALPVEDLIAPAVVLDIRDSVAADPDYALTVEDVMAWEARWGRVPAGVIVLILTGWGDRVRDAAAYRNADAAGSLHFPGCSPEGARLLVEGRGVRALGVDTLSIDRGLSRDFAVHKILGSAGRYALENVARLSDLPAVGATLIAAPMKIDGGSGGPARLLALVPAPEGAP